MVVCPLPSWWFTPSPARCGSDAAAVEAFSSRQIRVVIGEWSLGTCGMWGAHPATLVSPDFLYAFYGAAKSMFAAAGVEADFFWTGVVRTGGYDPTLYAEGGEGSRRQLLREMAGLAAHGGWAEYNRYVLDVRTAAPPDYLLTVVHPLLTGTFSTCTRRRRPTTSS